ncbi:MAG: phosphoglucosamine mutase [Clostridiaceae bacterium]|nr:phosphoglucosamine mutase [Clostridiaceae bacterium]
MAKLFGTDGVRGIANSELTAQLAFSLGQAGAYVLGLEAQRRAKIIVGADTRISGDMLEAAIAAGICSTGAQAELVGVIPTPAVAYLTRKLNADAGIVISASHNSMEYNGIKFFNNQGYKLSDEIEEKIEQYINDNIIPQNLPTGGGLGRIVRNLNAKDYYMEYAKDTVSETFNGLKVAIDCANGAASAIACEIFQQLGAQVFVINNKPDGLNINDGCGSTHIEQLQGFTKKVGADLGIAFDGDADRMLAVDENGKTVDGDCIMLICALDAKKRGKLNNNTVTTTIMSNLGMFLAAEGLGISIAKTKVGDRYVLEEMLDKGHNIGGEQSGHIIFLDYNTTGDGIITALQLVSVMNREGKSLSSLAGIMQKLPQVLVNAKVKNESKNTYLQDNEIITEIDRIEKMFSGKGRVLIRPSGTEPLIRVMIEGADYDLIAKQAKKLAMLIEQKTG